MAAPRATSLPSVTAPAAERAAVWLNRAARGIDDPRLAVDAFALCTLCRLLSNGAAVAADEVEATVAGDFPNPPWASASLLTGLTAAVDALQRGSRVAPSAVKYLSLLDELGSDSLSGANGVLVRLALRCTRDGATVPAPEGIPPRAQWLCGSPDRVRQFLADIEMASAFGTTVIGCEPPLPILIEGAAIAALRAYDLPLGMRLLRARRYVCDRPSSGIAMGFDFLRLSQCDDGSFGDYDTALAHMAALGHRNAVLQIKLPVTFQALWTMAELETPAFALVRSAFPASALDLLQ